MESVPVAMQAEHAATFTDQLVRTMGFSATVRTEIDDDDVTVHVDVGRYRERRREALAAFARKVAAEVEESGETRALEPMNAADRKVVHDTVAEIEGVATASEGEDPRRRVVIRPA